MSERTSSAAPNAFGANCSGLANAGVPTNLSWVSDFGSVRSVNCLGQTEVDYFHQQLFMLLMGASTQRGGYRRVRDIVVTALCRRAGRNPVWLPPFRHRARRASGLLALNRDVLTRVFLQRREPR